VRWAKVVFFFSCCQRVRWSFKVSMGLAEEEDFDEEEGWLPEAAFLCLAEFGRKGLEPEDVELPLLVSLPSLPMLAGLVVRPRLMVRVVVSLSITEAWFFRLPPFFEDDEGCCGWEGEGEVWGVGFGVGLGVVFGEGLREVCLGAGEGFGVVLEEGGVFLAGGGLVDCWCCGFGVGEGFFEGFRCCCSCSCCCCCCSCCCCCWPLFLVSFLAFAGPLA